MQEEDEMAGNYWIKLYLEILDDSKIMTLPYQLRWRMIEMFLLAGRYNKGGELPDTNELAWALRCPIDVLDLDLKQLEQTGMIEKTNYGWFVVNFEKRQAKMTPADKMKLYRDRLQKSQYYGDYPSDLNVTNQLLKVTQITDTESESYTESEKNDDGEVFTAFQNNIFMLTPMTSEQLKEDIDEYGKEWCLEAIKTTADAGVRNYKFFHAVLENRKKGNAPGKNGNGKKKQEIHTREEWKEHIKQHPEIYGEV